MEENNGPGQPKKPEVIDIIPLRFRANYPDLKEKLKNMAKKSGNSLNDYLIEVLNIYVKTHDPTNRKELEQNFESFFQKIDTNIDILESKLQTIKHTEHQYLKDFISINFPSLFEKKILYLKLIQNQIKAERQFLETLLYDWSPSNDGEMKIYNYLDYHIEKNKLPENINREDIIVEYIEAFYSAWFLQLNLYNIFKDINNFTEDVNALETFLFSDLLYSKLQTVPIFTKEKFDKLNKIWDECFKQSPYNIGGCKPFNLKNVEYFLDLLKSKNSFFEHSIALDTLRTEELKNEQIKELRSSIKPFEELEEYEKNIKRISKLTKLEKEFARILSLYPDDKISILLSSNLKKEGFLSSLFFYFDLIMYNINIEISSCSYSLEGYFKNNTMSTTICFKPYIVSTILDLEHFYDFLKERNGIENFLRTLDI